MPERSEPETDRGLYAGWIASLLVIAGMAVVGGVLWFTHHP